MWFHENRARHPPWLPTAGSTPQLNRGGETELYVGCGTATRHGQAIAVDARFSRGPECSVICVQTSDSDSACASRSSAWCSCSSATGGALAQSLPTATPESQGFSGERLERLHKRMHEFVNEGKHAGIVLLIARNGKIVELRTFGMRDREQKLRMEEDTIFRIYSMSKVIASAAAMILHEEGRLKLDDPVSKYLPAFDKPKVMTGGTVKAPVLVAAKTPITVKQLLTHTSGYIYGFGKDPIDKIYNDSKLLQAPTMAAFLERASKMPLVQQPGRSFRYGISIDLLGAVVEKVSGQSLDAFIESRITGPLGMKDTGFAVPAGKRARVAKVYTTGKDGELTERTSPGSWRYSVSR